jgi:hypothetical protein
MGLLTSLLLGHLLVHPALAQEEGQLAISAFADLLLPASSSTESGTEFRVNQAEVDLEGVMAPEIVAAMALAYDPDAETFALAVLALEMPLFSRANFTGKMTVGQFDVPFGIDYQVYASVDRRLVNGPLFLDCSHEGWNDLGARVKLQRGQFGADVFVINGNQCGRGVVDPIKFVERLDIKRAEGMRGFFTATETLELGVSGALFHDEAGNHPMTLVGADFQMAWGAFSAKGELVAQNLDRDTPGEVTNTGYYVQGMYEFGRYYGIARYGRWNPELAEAETPERLSLGAGYVVREGLEFRLQHDAGLHDLEDTTWVQMVMNFGSLGH